MDRIAELVERLELEPSKASDDARALVAEVLAFHAEGLRRLVAKLDPAVLAEACSDPLVESLLELHGIERPRPPAPEVLLSISGLLKKRPAPRPDDDALCDLCGEPAGAGHAHLLDLERRALACACIGCRLALGANPTSRYREVPRVLSRVDALRHDDAWWTRLGLPVGLAFFVLREKGVTAHYPGPAGTTESALPLSTWSGFATAYPEIARMEPDVHALLVDRSQGSSEHWVVGIDRCYELVERVRRHWRGLTGGEEARAELRRFFDELAREVSS